MRVREERLQASGLVLELARGPSAATSRTARSRRARPRRATCPATNPSTRNVCATSPFMPMTVFRYCSGSTRVRSAHASSTLSHFGRKRTGAGRAGVRQRRARDVEELAALLVAEADQRLEPLEGAGDLRHVHHAPGDDVAARRGPERREVAAEDLGARLGGVVRLRLLDRDEPAVGAAHATAPTRGGARGARARARRARRAARASPVSPCSRSR